MLGGISFGTRNFSVSRGTIRLALTGTGGTNIRGCIGMTLNSIGGFSTPGREYLAVYGPPCNRELLSIGSTRRLCGTVNQRFRDNSNEGCFVVDPRSRFRGRCNGATSGHHGLCGNVVGYRLFVCFG